MAAGGHAARRAPARLRPRPAVLNVGRWLRNYRRGSRGYAELLPWMALLTEDVVLCKDGALLALYEFSGAHLEAADPGEASRGAGALEQALRAFDERCGLWWIVDRRRSPPVCPGVFPDPISAAIEQQWCAELGRQAAYANRHLLGVCLAPAAHARRARSVCQNAAMPRRYCSRSSPAISGSARRPRAYLAHCVAG